MMLDRIARRTVGATAAGVVIIGVVLVPSRTALAEQPVSLQVKSSSWIQGSAFDVADFTSRCRDAGVALSPEAAVKGRPAATVTYAETQGPGFSMFGVGTPVGYGTNVAFTVTLVPTGSGRPLVTLHAEAETPPGLPKEQFHTAAIDAFKRSPRYALSCAAIAATLGSREQALRLLPWAVLDHQGAQLVEAMHFAPSSPLERAYVAVARRAYPELETLGTAAIEPLLLLFENSATPRNGLGEFPATVAENAQVLRRVLPLLTASNDDRVPDTLATFLNDYAGYRTEPDPIVNPLLAQVLNALGMVGTTFTLPQLQEWQSSPAPTGEAARAASAALSKRLAIE